MGEDNVAKRPEVRAKLLGRKCPETSKRLKGNKYAVGKKNNLGKHWKMPKEAIERISKKNTGKIRTEKQRNNISKALKGKPRLYLIERNKINKWALNKSRPDLILRNKNPDIIIKQVHTRCHLNKHKLISDCLLCKQIIEKK